LKRLGDAICVVQENLDRAERAVASLAAGAAHRRAIDVGDFGQLKAEPCSRHGTPVGESALGRVAAWQLPRPRAFFPDDIGLHRIAVERPVVCHDGTETGFDDGVIEISSGSPNDIQNLTSILSWSIM